MRAGRVSSCRGCDWYTREERGRERSSHARWTRTPFSIRVCAASRRSGAANAFLPGPPACLRSPGAAGGQAPYGCRSGQDAHDFQQTVVLAFQAPERASVVIRAVLPKMAFGFGDACVPVAFLPEVEGCGAAPEIAAELFHSLPALLSVLEEGNDLLFGECSCFHRSSSLSGAHKGSPCAPPGEIRMTLISFVHF